MEKNNTKKIGRIHEERAKSFLQRLGYRILEQNWQCGKIGEVDFIAIDKNRFTREYLVFIEVKFRKEGLAAAKYAVNYKKQAQLKKLSQLYLKTKKLQEGKTNISYDVIALSYDEIEHVKNIFSI